MNLVCCPAPLQLRSYKWCLVQGGLYPRDVQLRREINGGMCHLGIRDYRFVVVSSGCIPAWLIYYSELSTRPFMTLFVTQNLSTSLVISGFRNSSLATRSEVLVIGLNSRNICLAALLCQ